MWQPFVHVCVLFTRVVQLCNISLSIYTFSDIEVSLQQCPLRTSFLHSVWIKFPSYLFWIQLPCVQIAAGWFTARRTLIQTLKWNWTGGPAAQHSVTRKPGLLLHCLCIHTLCGTAFVVTFSSGFVLLCVAQYYLAALLWQQNCVWLTQINIKYAIYQA